MFFFCFFSSQPPLPEPTEPPVSEPEAENETVVESENLIQQETLEPFDKIECEIILPKVPQITMKPLALPNANNRQQNVDENTSPNRRHRNRNRNQNRKEAQPKKAKTKPM